MHNFLSQNILTFPMYILFTKIIKTFWFRNVTDVFVLAYLGQKSIKIFKDLKSLYTKLFQIFLNILILGQNVRENKTRRTLN